MTRDNDANDNGSHDLVSHVMAYGFFFLLGCIGMAGYFLAGGTPATNLIGAAVYIGFVCVFASVIGAPKLAIASNVPLMVAVAHYFLA